jgi:malto-oligosyltrehalose synthase/4-alpha-glucanotransferase
MIMYNPVSTYRVQFHKDFTLKDLDERIGYLQHLGIKTIYASPIFKAVPGSNHGYDVVNPYVINPEIGTESELRETIIRFQNAGIGWLQDIVPNHMAFHQANVWLMDVLEKGSMSVYASFFDITWATDFFSHRLMVPFLAESLEESLVQNQISVVFQQQALFLKIPGSFFPINARSIKTILNSESDTAPSSVNQFIHQLEQLHQVEDPVMYSLRSREVMMQFAALMAQDFSNEYIEDCLKAVNDNKTKLKAIVDLQFYRLCCWRETNQQINYRRFFTVNELICLNINDQHVFDQYHKLIGTFVREGLFQGLRVDHIDGLFDPRTYLGRLRNLCGSNTYIIVEKILEPGERLDTAWPVQGTTGYEFLSLSNNLFTRNEAEQEFSSFYNSLTGDRESIKEKIRNKKSLILREYMNGELKNLCRFFVEKNLIDDIALSEVGEENLRNGIALFLVHCPVYRYYGNSLPLPADEHENVLAIFNACKKHQPSLRSAINLIQDALLQKPTQGDKHYNERAVQFYQRCMQSCGPLMAKGVEDTLMYTFNRFVAHNEVGDSPGFFGLTTSDFHARMIDRQQHWPMALNGTSTHDTKRGEDARMRLTVLPDLADEWLELVKKWMLINQVHKSDGAPDVNDEYFIYQTLIGAFPADKEGNFMTRLEEYFTKALREAKRYSNWTEPDQRYESAVTLFVQSLLAPESEFLGTFLPFHKKVADYGIVNSLSQLILKFTCPGIPDIYQGTTNWDLTLVDPDNRRKIDYNQSQLSLNALAATQSPAEIRQLWANRSNGDIKLWMMHTLFSVRNTYSTLVEKGEYIPLKTKGTYKENCLAFARKHQRVWLVSVIPLQTARIANAQGCDSLSIDWYDTHIILPVDAPVKWRHLLTDAKGRHEGRIALNNIYLNLPVALLHLHEPERDRNAGILMSITSLPSAFGIGDFGMEARKFADFLARSRQTFWQLLPLNATNQSVNFSPYSAYSSMAGNILFISPDLLMQEGLLNKNDVAAERIKSDKKIDYLVAEGIKHRLLEIAWSNFKGSALGLEQEFESFKVKARYWLDDFALFEVIRRDQQGKPWYQWPTALKKRNQEELTRVNNIHAELVDKIKWFQFIFSKQWSQVKEYCKERGIQLVGDLPFYVNYDSVDVWVYPQYFGVDANGNPVGLAGVPPDYFNPLGQSWGMPVFRWQNLKVNSYDWWVKRIEKNLELYDLLRLDHFRAFIDYWEIPAGSKNAVGGKWCDGPREDFFRVLREKFGRLPFIAEDLGEINPDVFTLRDELGLPGMKILQFAFDENMPESQDIPHNYAQNFVVYTGTHDNNTTRGWYRKDIDNLQRERIKNYLNKPIREKTITDALMRLAYGTVARTVIIPMQDILNLDETARMNIPSTNENNWTWRMNTRPTAKLEDRLRELTIMYNR